MLNDKDFRMNLEHQRTFPSKIADTRTPHPFKVPEQTGLLLCTEEPLTGLPSVVTHQQ